MVARELISLSNSPPPCLRAHSIAGPPALDFLKSVCFGQIILSVVVYGTNLFEFNGHLFYKPSKLLP